MKIIARLACVVMKPGTQFGISLLFFFIRDYGEIRLKSNCGAKFYKIKKSECGQLSW